MRRHIADRAAGECTEDAFAGGRGNGRSAVYPPLLARRGLPSNNTAPRIDIQIKLWIGRGRGPLRAGGGRDECRRGCRKRRR